MPRMFFRLEKCLFTVIQRPLSEISGSGNAVVFDA